MATEDFIRWKIELTSVTLTTYGLIKFNLCTPLNGNDLFAEKLIIENFCIDVKLLIRQGTSREQNTHNRDFSIIPQLTGK